MRDSEQGLVLRARAGDQAAYGELVTRYQGRVRGWLRSLCGDFSAADDLAQETFLRAWIRLGDLRDPVRFGQWLMKIAYNEFLKSRRSRRSGERLMKGLLEQQGTGEDRTTTGAPEVALELRRALSGLSTAERAAVVLNYAYGYSHRQVSELTDLPLGTVKSLIHRGSLKVREQFDART